jgi:hypothetical protein
MIIRKKYFKYPEYMNKNHKPILPIPDKVYPKFWRYQFKEGDYVHPKYEYHFKTNPFNVRKLHIGHRYVLYKIILSIFFALSRNYYAILVPAANYIYDLVCFLHKKTLILDYEYSPSEACIILYFNRKNVDQLDFKVSTLVTLKSSPHHPTYLDHEALFLEVKQQPYTFGLVLTEVGFESILDCMAAKRGGELILLWGPFLPEKNKIIESNQTEFLFHFNSELS